MVSKAGITGVDHISFEKPRDSARGSILLLVPDARRYCLLMSLCSPLEAMGYSIKISSYLPRSGIFLGRPVLDKDVRMDKFSHLIVLDLGFLRGSSLKTLFPSAHRVQFAGDTPQSLTGASVFTWLRLMWRRLIGRSSTNFLFKFGIFRESKHYDVTLVSDLGAVKILSDAGRRAIWFPYWFDESILATGERDRPEFDLVTVSSPREEREIFFRELETDSSIRFRNFFPVLNSELGAHLLKGRVVLNYSCFGEVTMRFFEALGAGRLVVTNRLPKESGLEFLFDEDSHYFCFDSPQDVGYLLSRAKGLGSRLEKMQRQAQLFVNRHHSAEKRAQLLDQILQRKRGA